MPRKPKDDAIAPEPIGVEIPLPKLEVLERALVDPFGAPSNPIALKDPQFVTHWCNTELAGGGQLTKFLDAGYLKVRPEYLSDPESFQWTTSPEGYVTRGERHREILMYTTKEHQKRRAWAKAKQTMERMRMSKTDIQEAAAKHFGAEGDEAAEFLGRHIGGVTDSREVMQQDPTQR